MQNKTPDFERANELVETCHLCHSEDDSTAVRTIVRDLVADTREIPRITTTQA